MDSATSATIQAEIPAPLLEEVRALVRAGWYQSLDAVMVEALRHYLESRRPELVEHFVRSDIEWGLRGQD